MKPKTIVDINHIKRLVEEMQRIDNLDIDEISFVENGKPIDIPIKTLEKFKFTGLSNCDFISSKFYKRKYDENGKRIYTS